MKKLKLKLIFLFSGFYSSLVLAAEQRYDFSSIDLEKRFVDLTKSMRCVVCQNQNLFDSMAPLAIDLREQIFKMLEFGDADEIIINFMTKRYGEFILYNPPWQVDTLVLWLGPVLMLFTGLWVLVRTIYGR